jgi:glycerol kinase
LAIDQSTSGTKALVVNNEGAVLARSSLEHKQLYVKPGWVEHDPLEIYYNVEKCALAVLEQAGLAAEQVAALTITNQRETAVMWDRLTGEPVCNAIVWQCQRTADRCARYKADGREPAVTAATGLMLDPYFSASKWGWMLEHVPAARAKLDQGSLLAGTIDSWLVWKLTGGKTHATDFTNASRTSLFNIHTLAWDEEMCALFGVPASLLPEVKFSDEIFGWTDATGWLGASVPVTGVIGDSQGALFGNLCLQEGMAKATYGTGTSVLMNIGDKLAPAAGSGLVQTIAWGMNGSITYALEAIIRTSGDSLKWLRDSLGLFSSFEEMERLLADAPDNEGVYLVPAFVGLGAPYWQPDARAAITGMNRGTGKAHIIRAALESIAYQVYDAVELLQSVSGVALEELRADGGAAENALLMQFQADLLGSRVVRAGAPELSALGSVYMGGLAVGMWRSAEELAANAGRSRTAYEPGMPAAVKVEKLTGWQRAVGSLLESGQR